MSAGLALYHSSHGQSFNNDILEPTWKWPFSEINDLHVSLSSVESATKACEHANRVPPCASVWGYHVRLSAQAD